MISKGLYFSSKTEKHKGDWDFNEHFYLRNLSGSRVASYPPTIPSNANGASPSVENVNISDDDKKISTILQIFYLLSFQSHYPR